MLRLLRNKKAQNTVEYAILFAIVVGALTAMQLYLRRSLQARLAGGADSIPAMVLGQASNYYAAPTAGMLAESVTQLEPYYFTNGSSNMVSTTSEGRERGYIRQDGGRRELTGASDQRTGWQNLAAPAP